MVGSKNKYEYFAFISYKREDEKWAKWLQHKLEYYKLPSSVRKDNPGIPDKIRPVFKDTTDLEPGILAQKIKNALNSSKFLIVICSPRSANSVWVSKEVQSFIDDGRADHIIPFIIGGTPNASDPKEECYPEGLRQFTGEDELLGANINEMGRDAATIKVVARMFNLRFDTLWQRFERDKKRKQIGATVFGLFACLVAIIIGLLYLDRNKAYNELDKANNKLMLTISDLSKSRDSIRIGARYLELASDSIERSAKLLMNTNAQLKSTNKRLLQTTVKLEKERQNLETANAVIKAKQSNFIAQQILTDVESGNLYAAQQLILDNFKQQSSLYELPITPAAEKAIRLVHSKNYADNFVHTNALKNVPFTYILCDMCDSLQVFMDGRFLTLSANTKKILHSTTCDNLKPDMIDIQSVGFLDTSNERCGISDMDSIYAYDFKTGKLLWVNNIPNFGVFRPLNDSIFVIPNIFGSLDLYDSRSGEKRLTSSISGFRPIFTQPFRIVKNDVVYVDNDNILKRRNLFSGDTIWTRKFDHPISDDVLVWDNLPLIGVINRDERILYIMHSEEGDIITLLSLPEASKYQMEHSNNSIALLSNSQNVSFDSWTLPLLTDYGQIFKGRTYNSNLDFLVIEDDELYFTDHKSDEKISFLSIGDDDAFRIIKSQNDGILCIIRFEGDSRLAYISVKSLSPELYFISDAKRYDHDWTHGYIGYMYSHLPRHMRQPYVLPFSAWSQLTDISNDNRYVAAALYNNVIYVRHLTGNGWFYRETDGEIFSVRFTPDSGNLLIVSENGIFRYNLDLENYTTITNNKTGSKYCIVEPFNDKKLLALGKMNGDIEIISIADFITLGKTMSCGSTIIDMDISDDDRYLAAVLDSKELVVYELKTYEEVYREHNIKDMLNVNFDKSGEIIIVNTEDGAILFPLENINNIIDSM